MIDHNFFPGKRVTVFGLGLNSGGVGTVEFLVKSGVREIIVTDIKTKEELSSSLAKLTLYKNIRYILGQHRPEDFTRVDLVIKNPLIPWTNEYIKLALEHGVPVEMDSSIFMALVPRVPILGVTGTKGKTTTATLLAHLLETAQKKVVRVGIDRGSVLGMLGKVTKESIIVFELSSWRLSALHRIKKSPTLAIVTNMFPDHLNYYRTMDAYIRDKEAIFAYQKKEEPVIFNFDNELTRAMAERAPGKKYFFSQTKKISSGAFLQENEVIACLEGEEEKLFSYPSVRLLGKHNRDNVLAAVLAARLTGLTRDEIAKGVVTFSGVPHRLEYVSTVRGVRYINDSAATIPEASIATLSSLDTPIILLAGGSDKKIPLTSIETYANEIASRVKEIILFKGDFTDRLLSFLFHRLPDKNVLVVESMEGAVRAASRLAAEGDTVVLSPGAASFGIFQNEFDRGERFRQAIKNLSTSLA